jgi:hypothetical protein
MQIGPLAKTADLLAENNADRVIQIELADRALMV